MKKEELQKDLGIEEIQEDINNLRNKIQPYARPILYIGIILFLLLIFFVGFGIGANKICSQLDGFLDNKLICHLDYYNKQQESLYDPNLLMFNLT